jgi:hypothetical protein
VTIIARPWYFFLQVTESVALLPCEASIFQMGALNRCVAPHRDDIRMTPGNSQNLEPQNLEPKE